MKITVTELAQNANKYLYRDGGKVLCRDGAPEWVTDLCRKAHGEFMPDDWRYEFTQDALTAFEEELDCPSVDDLYPYTADRLRWLSSNLNRPGYCDEAQKEYGLTGGVLELIAAGMECELHEVCDLVHSALENRAELLDSDPHAHLTHLLSDLDLSKFGDIVGTVITEAEGGNWEPVKVLAGRIEESGDGARAVKLRTLVEEVEGAEDE